MISKVELKPMRVSDVSRVMTIERECFAVPWHESAYITEITNRSAYYIVAWLEDEIVGFAGMWVIMDESHITTIGVARDQRGKKIGEELLVGLLNEAIKRGARRVTLEVRLSNSVAQNLYRKYGFKPAAVRKGYYTDNHEDALVMWIDNTGKKDYQAMYRELVQKLAEGVVEDTGD